MSNVNGNSALKDQFQHLQEQQLRKKQRRKELKEISNVSKVSRDTVGPVKEDAFGVDDDLNLLLADEDNDVNKGNGISQELVDYLNSEIRELKDETGRLRKLLNEREFELKQVRKKKETDRDAPIGVTNENAASKIVELSKKLREITAELEGEKTKSRVLTKKCNDLESQNKVQQTLESQNNTSVNKSPDKDELRLAQDRVKQCEMRMSDLRNTNLLLKNDIKMAQKIISQEVGDGVTIQSLSSVPGSWKGRAEQIIALNNKVIELKSQLDMCRSPDFDSELLGSRSSRQPSSVDKQREQIRKMEKERKESQQKAAVELMTLEEDFLSQKQKFDASKARNKVLAGEVKSLKQQMQTLIDKGQHDDELISALMKQQSTLRDMLDKTQQTQTAANSATSQKVLELSAQKQQDDAVVAQLRGIIAEKESRLSKLEEEIQQIHINKLHEAQKEGLNAIFQLNNTQTQEHQTSHVTPRNESALSNQDADERLSSRLSEHGAGESVAERLGDTARRRSRLGYNRPLSSRTVSRITPSPRLHRQASLVESKESPELSQYRTICQATEVERDKLSELVKVLHNRLEATSKSLLDTQNESIQLKRNNALLEKKINKHNLETQGKRLNSSRIPNSGDCDMEELTTRLLIQRDENEALKEALSSAMKAKEADLRAYSEMMESTRDVFLQAMSQHGT